MDKNSSIIDSKVDTFTILSFALSRGITNLPSLVIGLLLIDVGKTFNVPVGITGQLGTASSLLSIIFAIIMGIISVRYTHKSLLTCGLILYVLSASTCYIADSFMLLLALYSLSGIALAMVTPMINALIGEILPVEKRTSAIGWTIAGLALIYLVGSLSTNFVYSFSGWRLALLLIVVPVTVLTLILVILKVPNVQDNRQGRASQSGYFTGYKMIFKNRSALACLLGTVMGLATWNLYLVYSASFLRQVYDVSISFVSFITMFICLSYVAGSLNTGRFTKILGRKSLSALTMALLGFFTLVFTSMPSVWLAFCIALASSFFAGMMLTVSISLTLEQVPHFRGTMMSVHSASMSVGSMLAASLGGVILLNYNYVILGIVMGIVGIIGSLSFHLYSIDPTQALTH